MFTTISTLSKVSTLSTMSSRDVRGRAFSAGRGGASIPDWDEWNILVKVRWYQAELDSQVRLILVRQLGNQTFFVLSGRPSFVDQIEIKLAFFSLEKPSCGWDLLNSSPRFGSDWMKTTSVLFCSLNSYSTIPYHTILWKLGGICFSYSKHLAGKVGKSRRQHFAEIIKPTEFSDKGAYYVEKIKHRVLRYGPFDALNTKVLEKIIIGGLFMTPPRNTLQCSQILKRTISRTNLISIRF